MYVNTSSKLTQVSFTRLFSNVDEFWTVYTVLITAAVIRQTAVFI